MPRSFSVFGTGSTKSPKKKAGRVARLIVPDERVTIPQPSCRTPDRILHPEPAQPDDWCASPLPRKRNSRMTK